MTRVELIAQTKVWYNNYSRTFSPSMASQLAGESIKLATSMEDLLAKVKRIQELSRITPYREACEQIYKVVDEVLKC